MTDTNQPPKEEGKVVSRSLRKKRRLIAFAIAFVFVGLLVAAGIHYYPSWNQERLLKRARNYLGQKDYRLAALTARRVLQLNNRNLGATRIMAEIADIGNSRNSLYWYHSLVELQPEQIDSQLDLGEHALRYGNLPTVSQVVEKISDKGRGNARYHELAGALAAATKRPNDAEVEFGEARRLEPGKALYKFTWAMQALLGDDPAKRDEARQIVQGEFLHSQYSAAAARGLIADALRRHDGDLALSLGKDLAQAPNATLNDQLAYLQLLHDLKRPEFAGRLDALEQAVVAYPSATAGLIDWLGTNHCALIAVEWSKRLPGDLATTMPVPMSIANAYAALGDWKGLRAIVVEPEKTEEPAKGDNADPLASPPSPSKAQWAAFEFMRLALAARTLREQGQLNESRIQWNAAVREVGKRPDALALLARAAVDWNWENESRELLWAVANTSTNSQWALEILYFRYKDTGATRNMLQVLDRLHQLNPKDLSVLNNLASLSLLSEGTTQQGIAFAEELYRREPKDPDYASTYAFALHLQGRTAEAIKLMESLGEEKLATPEYAAYYGVMIADAGNTEQARHYLSLGNKASLLPEERALVERATAKIDHR